MTEDAERGLVAGRYAVYDEIAAGGMATVHVGRLRGAAGFARTVAIKRLHPRYAKDKAFVAMFHDEARLAARIQHPNVGQTLDVVESGADLYLVMEYLPGESLARLLDAAAARKIPMPIDVAVGIASGMLQGLHAAHEARSDRGEPLRIVHRDVSPQNVIVGVDGVPKVVDFGIAKAVGRAQNTEAGRVKGKAAYMSPEQVRAEAVDRRTDVFAASAVVWEMLAGRRLFVAEGAPQTMLRVLEQRILPPSTFIEAVPMALDAVVLKGLARRADDRYATALEMADALERAISPATARTTGAWVESLMGDQIAARAARVLAIETSSVDEVPPSATVPDNEPVGRVSETALAEPIPSRTAPMPAPPPRPAEDQTHVSGVALVTSGASARRVRGRRILFAVLALACVIGVVALVGNARRASTSEVTPPPTPSPTPPAPSVEEPVAKSPDPPPVVAPAPAPRPSRGRAPAPRPRGESCNPPYRVDDAGIRIWKPECST
jgi:serine/threonine-protein kinase